MKARYGDRVEVDGTAIPGITGKLEIMIVETGKLIHSKKGGDGYVDTNDKWKRIYDAVDEALAKGGH